MLRIALISDSARVSEADLFRMAPALEQSARHAWDVWREHLPWWMRDIPPSIIPWDVAAGVKSARQLPMWEGSTSEHMVPLYFVDDTSRDGGTLAVHYVQGDRPAGRVYVENASGLNDGPYSVSEAASHEILEVMLNPWIDGWTPMPGRSGVWVANELCDPVQDHYEVEAHGIAWKVSNFVYPPWFERSGEGQVDHLRTLVAPGEIGPEGYVILRDADWRISYEFGGTRSDFRGIETVAKHHPMARTQRIGEMAESQRAAPAEV